MTSLRLLACRLKVRKYISFLRYYLFFLLQYLFNNFLEEIHGLLNSTVHNVAFNIEGQPTEDECAESAAYRLKNDEIITLGTSNQQTLQANNNSNMSFPAVFEREALVIDDSIVAAKITSKVLEKLQCKSTVCTSAQDGFDMLKKNSRKYAFVMLDIVMPNVDGVECLSWIKDDPLISHIPVFMLSGLEDQTLADVCLDRGADGMLLKPLIIDVVKKMLHQTRNNLSVIGSSVRGTGELIVKRRYRSLNSAENFKFLRPGRQAIAFQLYDSNCLEFNYPSDTNKYMVVLGFAPTIFLPDIHVSNGLIDVLKFHYNSRGSKKKIVLLITSDLQYSLAEAKVLYQIPFALLSDPFSRVSDKFVGTFDLGEKLSASNNVPYIPVVYDYIGPLVGITFLGKRRNILKSWRAFDDESKNVDITKLPPSVMEREDLTNSSNISDNFTVMNASSFSRHLDDSVVSEDSRDSFKAMYTCEEKYTCKNGFIKTDMLTEQVNEKIGTHHDTSFENSRDLTERSLENNLVLVVDDSNVSSCLAVKKIESLGYNTETTYNGQLAYDLLCLDTRKYSLVVCDVCMPICDGVDLLKMIKSNSKLSHLPVLMLSSLESRELEKALLEMGALDIIKKPFENSDFVGVLKKLRTMDLL